MVPSLALQVKQCKQVTHESMQFYACHGLALYDYVSFEDVTGANVIRLQPDKLYRNHGRFVAMVKYDILYVGILNYSDLQWGEAIRNIHPTIFLNIEECDVEMAGYMECRVCRGLKAKQMIHFESASGSVELKLTPHQLYRHNRKYIAYFDGDKLYVATGMHNDHEWLEIQRKVWL